ncbi:sodium:solute symporter [bacterium]|nr:sodium:solute symporter [candidate division CSSED10-310 bacterium]
MTARYIVVAVYALIVIGVGIYGSRHTKSFVDFMLGGRGIGPWMTAFSYGTAYFSAVLFIGFAGKIGWGFGMSGLWIAAGNAIVGVFLVWRLLGRRIKDQAVQYNVHTMPEFLEARYHSPGLKLFTSLAIFIFFIPYSAAVFMGLSYLFTSTFHLPYAFMLLFMAVFTAVYLVLGGYRSMALLDVIFGVIMSVGVVILLASTIHKGGGLDGIVTALHRIDPRLTRIVGPPGWWPLVSLVFLTSVAPLAMPQLVQKFYAVRDARAVKIGMFASTFFAILVSGTAYFTGALTRIFITADSHPHIFTNVAGKLVPNFDALMPELLTTVIHPALSVIILLLILSASMSTLAALVLISSSAITKDLYAGFIKPAASDRALTRLMRLSSLLFILVSLGLAFLKPAVIVTILAISWGAIASVFLGPFLWGLFSTRLDKTGAWAGAAGGLTVCLLLFLLWGKSAVPQAGTIGMISSVLFVPIVGGAARWFGRR